MGSSLENILRRGGRIPLRDAVEYGKRTIELLQRLHTEAGLVHGDLHLGNVCMRDGDPRTLILIDFEKAFHVRDETDELITLSDVHPQHTPWQLEGSRYARRDDIYKAFSMIAQSVTGKSRFNTEARNCRSKPDFIAWKRGLEFFRPQGFDPIDSHSQLSLPKRAAVWVHLRNISKLLNALISVKTEIPYQQIVRELDCILAIISPSSKSTTDL